jgi:hypothetical protein
MRSRTRDMILVFMYSQKFPAGVGSRLFFCHYLNGEFDE